MHGRSVPRVNRQAEPDRTHILDEMNLSAPSFLPEAFRTRHRVTGPDGKVLHNVFGADLGGRKLLGVILFASVSCARGQSASRLSEASDLFGSGSLCYMSLLLFLLCCMLLYVLGLLYPARLRSGKQCLCRFFSWFVQPGRLVVRCLGGSRHVFPESIRLGRAAVVKLSRCLEMLDACKNQS